MLKAITAVIGVVTAFSAIPQDGLPRTAAPAGAISYIVSPANGEVVPPTFKVIFGLTGMGIAPAGIDKAGTGHHHILIDSEVPDLELPIPATDQIKHFGGGQTEVWLTLPPGPHTLQLLLGDKLHIPHQPPVLSQPISITVAPDTQR